MIVVDDGSTDGTAAVPARLCNPASATVRHYAGKPRRLGRARNAALDAARGEYVLFVDADDRLCDQAVPALLALADRTHADIIQFQIRKVDAFGKVLAEPQGSETCYDLTCDDGWRLAFNAVVGNLLAWNGCYRRQALQGLRFAPFCNGEDLLFGLQAFCRASSILVSPRVLYEYVQRGESASRAATTRHVKSVVGVVGEMGEDRSRLRSLPVREADPVPKGACDGRRRADRNTVPAGCGWATGMLGCVVRWGWAARGRHGSGSAVAPVDVPDGIRIAEAARWRCCFFTFPMRIKQQAHAVGGISPGLGSFSRTSGGPGGRFLRITIDMRARQCMSR